MRRFRLYLKTLPVVLMSTVVLYFVGNWVFSVDRFAGLTPLDADQGCLHTLSGSQEENVHKIQSYSFPGSRQYLTGLSLSEDPGDEKLPDYPTIVTALSASHFVEGMQLVENVNMVVRKKYPEVHLVIFDLGLAASQRTQMEIKCDCLVRSFPFEQFPDHFGKMKGYAWKPLAIQLIIAEHPFVFWTDASIRFQTDDLDPIFRRVKANGVMAAVGFESLAMRTSRSTFDYLHETPCVFRDKNEFEATFMSIYATPFVKKNFLLPWVSCALTLGCMVPVPNPSHFLDCDTKGRKPVYHLCHRYDQSVMSILLHRLYGNSAGEHKMLHTFYQICKGQEDLWFLPNVMNELVVSSKQNCF